MTTTSENGREGVVIVGSITADVTTFSKRLPQRGETILGEEFTLLLGGKGANQAVASGLAGAPSFMVGCVGNDLFRPLVTDGLEAHGVDTSELRVVEAPTGIAHIRVDDSGENDIVMVPLANDHLTPGQISDAVSRLAPRASVLLTQLEIPREAAAHAVRAARTAGLTVILDPAPAAALDRETWASVDFVTPNETEASLITGIPVTDAASAVRAGEWFLAQGTGGAIITLASAGAVLVTADRQTVFDSYPVTAVDTTAAGDAFSGYLGASLAAGLSIDEAIRRAMAAGALAVTKKGASPSLPAADDVDLFLSAHVPSR
ncbi:ribokinase [Arthrobacter sp. Soil763]|uniref:ribokinase n=1 Tax=Arthrobacter sp. Soil763 TaxID=1736402 RepID=UPI0006F7F874|nr:ribokinase [Arthrobacter sp. Soil763]KRE81790.1 sugar kinase [Arthrobacter sp. Soil763]